MKKHLLILGLVIGAIEGNGQNVLDAESLWKLGRVSALGITKDGKTLVYNVGAPSVKDNVIKNKSYSIPLGGGTASEISNVNTLLRDKNISPNNKYVLYHDAVKVEKISSPDVYPDLEKSNVKIYDELDYRHWDTYHDGTFNHVFLKENSKSAVGVDLMRNEKFHTPTKPYGGEEDYVWSPDSKKVIYVSKKLAGTAYANSTNTDLYEYNLETSETVNLTPHNLGYDLSPAFSNQGDLAWLRMKNDGYEAGKNDIIVMHKGVEVNLTGNWDGTVDSFKWSEDGKKIFFLAPVLGTVQLFEVNFPGLTKVAITVQQITDGDFDVTDIVGFSGSKIILGRYNHSHANEIFSYDLKTKKWFQITHVNTDYFKSISVAKSVKKWVTTTDGKQMLVWVILPPNFDETKKYPTLLYLQGGPQGALSHVFSYRWNFLLMASEGYIVVAPNRRGMPGHGVKWNEEISKDWGGQAMEDYLSAIDEIAKEPYVDTERIGAVGASYGGYSAFYLAGIHNNRFKTFIAHAGIYNLESMYGTTEELFFVNWDMGGPYWDKDNTSVQKTYTMFNPIKNVNKWNTPMLVIHGEKDYRVPIGQGQEAFQALQQKGIKSRFVYFPDENHWILKPQNSIVWQREFFRWLKETL